KQLNKYGFKRHDRGKAKALYSHSGDKFRQGRPDLLPHIMSRPKPQKRPSTPLLMADSSPLESGSQTDSPSDYGKLDKKELITEILGLKRELESSEERCSAIETRLQAAENRLELTEQRLLKMENQLQELLQKPEQRSTRDTAPNSAIGAGPARPVDQVDAPLDALISSSVPDSEFLAYYTRLFQSISSESYLAVQMPTDPLDHLSGLTFLAP
ncbi:hypothetical protein FRC01_003146, partial [Tulasnella sp. 417]